MLEPELQQLEHDAATLAHQVADLQAHHDALFREVAQFEADNKHKNLAKPHWPARPATRLPDDPDDAPPLIQSSYFDDSILRYFADRPAQPAKSHSPADMLLRIHLRAQASANALYESVLRLGGTTAFPINAALYDAQDDALLGLRFDVMSHASNTFLLPHYIILRTRSDAKGSLEQGLWTVFRYTTPAYVPLDEYSVLLLQEDGLLRFVDKVRHCLVSIQYKHDKLDQIAQLTHNGRKIVASCDKDLLCTRVVLRLAGQAPVEIELDCGISQINSASCSLPKVHAFVLATLAGTPFVALNPKFAKVFAHLRTNNYI